MTDETDIISTTSEAPRVRTTQDLSAQIKTAGGALTVSPNDSRYIVAINNSLFYSVTQLSNGQFRITESQTYLLVLGGLALVGLLFWARG